MHWVYAYKSSSLFLWDDSPIKIPSTPLAQVNESFHQRAGTEGPAIISGTCRSKGFKETGLFSDTVMKTNIWRTLLQLTKSKDGNALTVQISLWLSVCSFKKEWQSYHPAEQFGGLGVFVAVVEFLLFSFIQNPSWATTLQQGLYFHCYHRPLPLWSNELRHHLAPSLAKCKLLECPFLSHSLVSLDLSRDLLLAHFPSRPLWHWFSVPLATLLQGSKPSPSWEAFMSAQHPDGQGSHQCSPTPSVLTQTGWWGYRGFQTIASAGLN